MNYLKVICGDIKHQDPGRLFVFRTETQRDQAVIAAHRLARRVETKEHPARIVAYKPFGKFSGSRSVFGSKPELEVSSTVLRWAMWAERTGRAV